MGNYPPERTIFLQFRGECFYGVDECECAERAVDFFLRDCIYNLESSAFFDNPHLRDEQRLKMRREF